MEILSRS